MLLWCSIQAVCRIFLFLFSAGSASAWSPLFLSASSDSSSQSSAAPSILLQVDLAKELTSGTTTLPPMVSVPCSVLGNNNDDDKGALSCLRELIQPPNVETLYDWYVNVQQKPDADPSWAVVWPTAVTLANYLLANPSVVQGKQVIELGCGLGLAGLTAASSSAQQVLLTDREPFALHCAMSTAAVHDLQVVQAAILDWNDENISADIVESADIILASDVLYDNDCIEAFVGICTKIAAPTGAQVLLTDPVEPRTPGARDMLRKSLLRRKSNVQIEEIELPVPQPMGGASSMDAKDHQRRMQEPTVLLKFDI
ncbi:flavoprotein beta subunit lysine methyltransferase [Seminavis robusta]|uniref:Flavoprotein beta subunit lysine methyltransferase n=1 Tax=Seminavis robusta TaxID=568900 RepID=A0A9N8DLI5_9STRA|nr:flavoprotein beta subunit lysine methyltransferase [Seminavis robusta]|eukprot:Sro147_g068000.1 flavoprotein beta subunit lysine methyltransferase (312) ;mRNA; f:92897-93832